MPIRLRRIYEPAAVDDGFRVLADRIWPRGLTKEQAAVDLWLKELAPSTPLRKWFDHDPAKWPEFLTRYHRELAQQTQAVEQLRSLVKQKAVTLLFGARDEKHNNAVALLNYLEAR